jgi:hypothetical protein
MDAGAIFAFLFTAVGGIVVAFIGLAVWQFFGKGTSSNAETYGTVGKLMALGGGIIFVVASVGVGVSGPYEIPEPPPIDTDYYTTAQVDSTTYVWDTADSSSTDENSGTSEINIDNDAHTINQRIVCDWSAETASALSGCSTSSFDVSSFSFTITRQDESEVGQDTRITSVVWIRIQDITEWTVRSNASGNPDLPIVLKNSYGIPLIMITDGAGNANQLGGLKGVVGEFSPGESQTSAGVYWVVDETQVSLYWPQQTKGFNAKFWIEDNYGFSQEWSYSLSTTMQE